LKFKLDLKNDENQELLNSYAVSFFALVTAFMLVQHLENQVRLWSLGVGFTLLLLFCLRYLIFLNFEFINKKKQFYIVVIDMLVVIHIALQTLPENLMPLIYIVLVIGASLSYGQFIGKIALYGVILFELAKLPWILNYNYYFDFINDLVVTLFPLTFVYVISIFFIKTINNAKSNADMLKKSNEQLGVKIAEFYTLQYIQNSISTIRDTRLLFESVNDMIIGVIGPTNSSIILRKDFDRENMDLVEFELWATNIPENKREVFLKNDCPRLWKKLKVESGFIWKVTECRFEFNDENLKSLIVVPLVIKDKKAGFIVVSHIIENALNEEFLRLLDVISGNLSIALENTWLYEKMQDLATIDALTKVYNRGYFNQAVEEELAKAYNKSHLAIAICDIDFFKKVNDNYGHLFGDIVLREVARILQTSLRSGDILVRYGGEEFVIIFPKADAEQAFSVVERLRNKIAGTLIQDKDNSITVTISFGIAAYPEDGTSVVKILQKADEALYKAKRDGRNCSRKAKDVKEGAPDENLCIGGNQRDR